MSLIPDIQDAIADLIDAATTVPVDVGYPGFVQPEHIWIRGAVNVTWTNAVSNLTQHDETGEIPVLIAVTKTAADYAVPRDRAFAIADVVTAAIEADRTLGATVDVSWIAGVESEEALVDNERQVGVTVRVSYSVTVA